MSKEKYFDKIIKSIIRLLVPYKHTHTFEQFIDALSGNEVISLEVIQNIVMRLKETFPEEIKQLDISNYKSWIGQNESRWKEKIELIHLDKLFYGLAKKTE